MSKRAFTDTQCRWIGERWQEGYSQADLAAFLGVNRETIRRVLMRQGLRSVCRGELPLLEERKEEYAALDAGGRV